MSKKKPIEIIINKKLVVEPDGIYEGKVTKSGTGASIGFFKRFVDKEVLIIVKDKIKKGTEAGKKKRIKEALEKLGQIDDIKIHRKQKRRI